MNGELQRWLAALEGRSQSTQKLLASDIIWHAHMQQRVLRVGNFPVALLPCRRQEPFQLSRYDLFNPFLNCSGGQLKRLGNKGDGGKW